MGLPVGRIKVSVYLDEVTLWWDTSDTPLHRRGYRLETAKAPLREDIAFAMLYAPVSQVIDLFFNAWSRRNEYQADAFASSTYDGEALGNALTKLHVKTLSNLRPHPAYVFTHFSHPTLFQVKHLSVAGNELACTG